MIAPQHGHIPSRCSDGTIWIDTGGHLIVERLQQLCVSLPPEIDVTTLDLGHQRRRSHRAHSLPPVRRFGPTAHCNVRKKHFADSIRVLRIDSRNSFVGLKRFFPLAFPPSNGRDQSARISIAWRLTRSELK